MNFIIDFIACLLIIHCVYYKRNDYCKIKLFSKDWFFIILLLVIANILLKVNG